MKRAVVSACLMFICTLSSAQQTAGDALGDALRAPLPGARLPDRKLPVYLKQGSLVCERWQGMSGIAEQAARAPDSQQAAILRSAGCAVAPRETRINVVEIDQKSWEGAAMRTYGLAKIWWQESSGINDIGFVGVSALRN